MCHVRDGFAQRKRRALEVLIWKIYTNEQDNSGCNSVIPQQVVTW